MKQLKERMASVAQRQRGRAPMTKSTESASKLPPLMKAPAVDGRKESLSRAESFSQQQPRHHTSAILPPIAGSRANDRSSSRAVDLPWHARAAERLSAVQPHTEVKDDMRRLDALLTEAAESHAERMLRLHHQFKATGLHESPLPPGKNTESSVHGPSFRPESRSLRSGKGKRAPTRGDGAAESKPQSAKRRQRCRACRKKLGLADTYTCKCAGVFCANHRHAEAHECTYDYKAAGRAMLAANK